MSAATSLKASLTDIVGERFVFDDQRLRPYLSDATESRDLRGVALLAVLPRDADEVAAVMRCCHQSGVPVVPRGGGTGFAGGAVPTEGSVVLALERLTEVWSIEPERWRAKIGAGMLTADVRRLARENGLLFPPDPGAAESSQIGGNVATNAGGPHAFKYGTTGAWVTGIDAVLPDGRPIAVGGVIRKDVAGYDLLSLLIGSEGTLAVITSVTLRLIPAVESAMPVVAAFRGAAAGAEAIATAMASGVAPAAIEFLDGQTTILARASFPGPLPVQTGFVVIAEADGTIDEARRGQKLLADALGQNALAVQTPSEPSDVAAIWRWRDGVALIADGHLGRKVSEDICVPIEHLAEAVDQTQAIGDRHGLAACSWGHAGDGNLHSTFMFAPDDANAAGRAVAATDELFQMAIDLGGTISGEHGVGLVKNGKLRDQWEPAAIELHGAIKRAFDPANLLNPGKKVA